MMGKLNGGDSWAEYFRWYVMACVCVCDYRRGIDWRMDLLTPFGTKDTYSDFAVLHILQIISTR
jgi:hypothetical protein